MSIWTKVNTLLRASAEEPVTKRVDADAVRIFEQELRDAEQAMGRSRRQLACLMAEKKFLQRDNDSLQLGIRQREDQATEALTKGHQDLAVELAATIAEDENLLTRQQQHLDRLQQQETRLRRQLRDIARARRHYQSELRTARATRSEGRVTVELRGYRDGMSDQLASIDQSIARIRARQEHLHAMDDALTEPDHNPGNQSLDDRLRAAGIDTGDQRASRVLERIRSRGEPGLVS